MGMQGEQLKLNKSNKNKGHKIGEVVTYMKIEVVTGFFRRFWLELPTAEVAATAEAAAAKETACDEATEGKQSFAPSRSD